MVNASTPVLPPSVIVWSGTTATLGGSFTPATLIETVSLSLNPSTSVDRMVKVSPPAKLVLPR